MGLGNTVKSAHVALGLAPEVLDAVDVIMTISKQLRMIDPEVVEIRHVKHVVASPAVLIDDTIWPDLALDDWDKRGP